LERAVTGTALVVWALFAAMVWAAGYFVACSLWPFTNCRRCKGDGKKRSPSGRNWRPCKKCKGTGRRVRTGRRFWTWASGQPERLK
jgi:hypothetical protein